VSVDKRYEQYCLASPFFYDSPGNRPEQHFVISGRPLPDGWRRECIGNWMINIAPGPQLPGQGWKIHVSGCLDNSEDVITRVWEYCIARAITFKFLSGRLAVLVRNGKYAPRGSSGKIVAIYPVDEAACGLILTELDQILGGEPGPYILSDLRYGAGPLYVRYGGFTERHCLDPHGNLVPAIENPAGELVPDLRSPVFSPPAWAPLPPFLAPSLAARNAARVDELPYQVEDVLHFSNGGGVYLGRDKQTGEQVVLKEARPHAGLAADGSDAVARLRREHDILRVLSGLGIAPEARGFFQVGEHHFLAEEFIDGASLHSCQTNRYPLLTAEPDPAESTAYAAWALRICAGIERALDAMHERGVIFNDLHTFNVMVRSDDSVVLIDFEAASYLSEGRRVTIGNPGFVAPRDRTGPDIDAYSIACLRLALFMPLTSLFALDRSKATHIAAVIAEYFPVPAEFLDQAVREILRSAPASTAKQGTGTGTTWRSDCEWGQLSTALARAITSSATPSRDDRLFPGDIEQFAAPGGGLGIAHGAAGVLYALAEAADLRIPEYEEWLRARAVRPVTGSRIGLYDGLGGVAWVLSRLGHGGTAAEIAGLCLDEQWERLGPDLYGGLAGFALAMLDIGDVTGAPALVDAGLKAAEILAGRATEPGLAAGLLRGSSGQALAFIRLYERTADPAYLDAAERAIAADLDRCVTDGKGALQVDEGWRTLPYLNAGSAGVGMVIDRFLPHRPAAGFAQASAAIRIAAQSVYYAQAGLFNGRAGMILYLAGQDRDDPRAAAHIRRLAWHAMPYAGGIAFPGEQLLRLSMDLGTGTAGILLAMAAALGSRGAALPFLGPALSLPGESAQGSEKERVKVRR
jgi:predicted Ser/Thr protein kinase